MSEEIILEARDIWHSYEENDRFSLQGLDLKVKKGSKVAFMGANGSGKSTFFLCCNRILRPQKGDILFHGKPVSYKRKELLALRAKVGIVFQDPDTVVFCQRGAGNLIRDPESGCCKRTGKNRSGAGDGRTGDRALSKTAGTCVKRRAEKTGLDRGYFSDASGDHHFG